MQPESLTSKSMGQPLNVHAVSTQQPAKLRQTVVRAPENQIQCEQSDPEQ
jgi:hypothetical protein